MNENQVVIQASVVSCCVSIPCRECNVLFVFVCMLTYCLYTVLTVLTDMSIYRFIQLLFVIKMDMGLGLGVLAVSCYNVERVSSFFVGLCRSPPCPRVVPCTEFRLLCPRCAGVGHVFRLVRGAAASANAGQPVPLGPGAHEDPAGRRRGWHAQLGRGHRAGRAQEPTPDRYGMGKHRYPHRHRHCTKCKVWTVICFITWPAI